MNQLVRSGRVKKTGGRYQLLKAPRKGLPFKALSASNGPIKPIRLPIVRPSYTPPPPKINPNSYRPLVVAVKRGRGKQDKNIPEKMPFFRHREWTTAELIAWAWANGRFDILAQFGIHVSPEFFEPEF